MIDTLLQRALKVRNALGAAPESHLGAEVVPAAQARPAGVAGDADLKRNPVADLERAGGNLISHANDHASGLMA